MFSDEETPASGDDGHRRGIEECPSSIKSHFLYDQSNRGKQTDKTNKGSGTNRNRDENNDVEGDCEPIPLVEIGEKIYISQTDETRVKCSDHRKTHDGGNTTALDVAASGCGGVGAYGCGAYVSRRM